MGTYDDLLNIGEFEKVESFDGKGGKKHMIRRPMTETELKAANRDLMDRIADYAEIVEYFLNKTGMTIDQVKKEIHEPRKGP